jgi:hypothetical protein
LLDAGKDFMTTEILVLKATEQDIPQIVELWKQAIFEDAVFGSMNCGTKPYSVNIGNIDTNDRSAYYAAFSYLLTIEDLSNVGRNEKKLQ